MLAIRFRRIAVLCITFAVSLIAGVQTRTHPYLFFSSSDTATIRNRANSAGPANQFWNLILADEANRYMASPYGGELLANFNCHENIYSLALAYVLTGNSAYVDRLKVLMWQGENSQLWGNQKGLLDPARGVDDYNYWLGAKKIIGECLVYDLLSNDENLTLQQKQDIKNAILSDLKNQHGPYAPLRQSVLNTYSNHYFSNWLAVTGAALGIAAMTLYDDPDYPEAASDLQTAKERVITAEDSFLKRYFPEGANFEGVTYSFLALDRVLIMMYMLSRFDGVDYFNQADIASVISKIPEWWAYEVLPKRANPLPTDPLYRCFNDISDMYYRGLGWESGQLTGLLIVGAKYNKPLCRWIFDNTIQTIPNLIKQTDDWSFLSRAETPMLFTALLTYDGLPSVEPSSLLPKSKIWYERGLVYCRTSDTWAGLDDIQFAMEGHQIVDPVTHGYSKGHTQGDKNHFTLSAFGEDFVTDQGYAVERHNYIYIDGNPQAHNPYPVNGLDGAPSSTDLRLSSSSVIDYIHGDATDAFNHIYATGDNCPPFPYCVFDQTSPFGYYVNPVEHAYRYVNFVRASNGIPTYIVIADDIKKSGTQTHEYRWRAHTLYENGVTLGNPTVISGAQDSNNKLYLYYYDPTPTQITPVLSTIQYTEGPDQTQGYNQTTLSAQQFDLGMSQV